MDRRTLASYVEIVLEAHVEAKKKQQAAMASTAKDIAWTPGHAAAALMAIIDAKRYLFHHQLGPSEHKLGRFEIG
jgi:hypothetical protein